MNPAALPAALFLSSVCLWLAAEFAVDFPRIVVAAAIVAAVNFALTVAVLAVYAVCWLLGM